MTYIKHSQLKQLHWYYDTVSNDKVKTLWQCQRGSLLRCVFTKGTTIKESKVRNPFGCWLLKFQWLLHSDFHGKQDRHLHWRDLLWNLVSLVACLLENQGLNLVLPPEKVHSLGVVLSEGSETDSAKPVMLNVADFTLAPAQAGCLFCLLQYSSNWPINYRCNGHLNMNAGDGEWCQWGG